jgi:CRISPR/Cas system-associated exonuclease Cas4 (RecB family)
MTKNLLKQVMSKAPKGGSGTTKEDFVDFTEGLTDIIQSGYLAQTKSYFSKKDYFAPSTLTYGAGECARFWYLAFDGAVFEDNSDAYGVANRTQGSMGHERIQKAVLNSGLLVEDMEFDTEVRKYNKQVHPAMEFRVKTQDPPINGYGDVMLNYNGNRILGEIKTSPSDAFEYKKINKKPKLGHLMQLIIYMKILKVDKGVVIYENKNNHELLALPVSVNDRYRQWVDNAFDWMRTVRKAWVDRTMPQKTYRSNSKICKNCPLQKACAEAETGVIKIKPLELLENETL